MISRKAFLTLCGMAVLTVLATSSTGAMVNSSKTTYFTFSKAVQVTGVSLPAGTYIFEVINPGTGSDVVRVTSRDRSKLYALRITRAIYRPHTRDLKPSILLGEQAAGTPPTVKAWFPDGEVVGREFIQ
jgi:hypothetical protein